MRPILSSPLILRTTTKTSPEKPLTVRSLREPLLSVGRKQSSHATMDGPVYSLRDPLTLTPRSPNSDSIEPSTTTTTTTMTTKRPLMDPMLWHKVAAVSGMAALGLGTYGAHVFRPKNASYKEVWQTASLYHLVHTTALVGAPFTKHPHIFGGLLTAGILAFSGTCYTVAYLEDRKYSLPAPFGGFAFIAAWASLLF